MSYDAEFMKWLEANPAALNFNNGPIASILPREEEIQADEIVDVENLGAELDELYATGFSRGKSTGWSTVDQFFTLRRRDLTVVTGYPSHGKSAWMDNVIVNSAVRHNWQWALFPAESLPLQRHLAGLAEVFIGKPFSDGARQRMTRAELDKAKDFFKAHITYMRPSERALSPDRLVNIAATMMQTRKLDAILLDPWNELDHSRPANLREDEYISAKLSMIRWFARHNDVEFFIVAHPRNIPRDKGKQPPPTLGDIKGASEWRAKADNGICIYREDMESPESTIFVQKARLKEVGKQGAAVLTFDRPTGRFHDPYHRPTIDELVQRQREPGDDDE